MAIFTAAIGMTCNSYYFVIQKTFLIRVFTIVLLLDSRRSLVIKAFLDGKKTQKILTFKLDR